MPQMKAWLKKVYLGFLHGLINLFTFFLTKRRKMQVVSLLLEQIPFIMEIPIKGAAIQSSRIKMFCNSPDTYYRGTTFYSKEPKTIEWIDNFGVNSVVWDIGANVGCYSLYSAFRGHRVLAFEPAASNYWLLNKNIQINGLSDRIKAFCIAFSENTVHGFLNLGDMNFGGACSRFSNKEMRHFDYPGRGDTRVEFQQGMISFSMDDLVQKFGFEIPRYIKIDVDGLECEIVKGGIKTLANPKLKKVLIELEDFEKEKLRETCNILFRSGFVIESKTPVSAEDPGIFNYVFSREQRQQKKKHH